MNFNQRSTGKNAREVDTSGVFLEPRRRSVLSGGRGGDKRLSLTPFTRSRSCISGTCEH